MTKTLSKVASQDILEQLVRVTSHPQFWATPRQKQFLEFIVRMFLEGKKDEIKGYTIATTVLGRDQDFDQATDSIVSVEAIKLRRALEHYYMGAGKEDTVQINIPKGGYVPEFRFQNSLQKPENETAESPTVEYWPSILIYPLQNLSTDPANDFVAQGVMTELAIELSLYSELQVLIKPATDIDQPARELKFNFSINGSIRSSTHVLKVAIQLVEQKTGRQLWGEQYKCDTTTTDILIFQEDVARQIATRIGEEHGVIAKSLFSTVKNKKPSQMASYEAILSFYKHNATLSTETFLETLDVLEHASIAHPECSLIWTFLGRLHGENYAFETLEPFIPIEKAIECSERGVHLFPSCQRARIWLAINYLVNNELSKGLVQIQEALAINPNSMIFWDMIGYALALLGKWQEGHELIRKAIKYNPYHRPWVYHVLCLDWLLQGEYKNAYLETKKFKIPTFFWDPLLEASAAGLYGKEREGRRAVKKLLKLKPSFPDRGRVLIRHFFKPDRQFDLIIEGLNRSGLNI